MPDSRYNGKASSAKFTSAHRLLRNNGFGRVLNAENISDKNFKIFFMHNDEDNARLGIIASKKTLPHSVDRNCAKRVVREAFRQHRIKLSKLDLVVMVRRNCAPGRESQCLSLDLLFNKIEDKCAGL